jgi:hypothetical protein
MIFSRQNQLNRKNRLIKKSNFILIKPCEKLNPNNVDFYIFSESCEWISPFHLCTSLYVSVIC